MNLEQTDQSTFFKFDLDQKLQQLEVEKIGQIQQRKMVLSTSNCYNFRSKLNFKKIFGTFVLHFLANRLAVTAFLQLYWCIFYLSFSRNCREKSIFISLARHSQAQLTTNRFARKCRTNVPNIFLKFNFDRKLQQLEVERDQFLLLDVITFSNF